MTKEQLFQEMLEFFNTADNYTSGDLVDVIDYHQQQIKKFEANEKGEKVKDYATQRLCCNCKYFNIKTDEHGICDNPKK